MESNLNKVIERVQNEKAFNPKKDKHSNTDTDMTEVITFFSVKYDLTPRESQILTHICIYGCSNQELCEKFYVTRSTIKNHITNIYKKTDTGNSRELLSLFFKAAFEYLTKLF